MFLFVFSLIASTHFPICTAEGDQLYPDVCWDGEAFWVVWSDDRDGTTDVYATRIDEEGNVEEPFLIYASETKSNHPHLACSPDTLCLTFLGVCPGLEPPFSDSLCYILLDDSGTPYWANHRHVGALAGSSLSNVISPVRCKDHFALLYTWGEDFEIEFPTWGGVSLLEGDILHKVLEVNTWFQGVSGYVSGGIWSGERLLCSTSNGFIWREDNLDQNPHDSNYFYPRSKDEFEGEIYYFYPGLAMTMMGDRIGMVGKYLRTDLAASFENYWFDLVDTEGNLVNEDPLYLNLGDDQDWCLSTSLAYGNGRFVAVSDLRVGDYPHWKRTLWGTEIDTNVTPINEGFLMAGPNQERNPDICFGENHFLLVWSDNRSGDWDIYGMILDSLQYSGVSEPALHSTEQAEITVSQTVFTEKLQIHLAAPLQSPQTVVIRNVLGRVVRTLEVREATCVWDGRDEKGESVSSGVYFISFVGKSKNLPVKVVRI